MSRLAPRHLALVLGVLLAGPIFAAPVAVAASAPRLHTVAVAGKLYSVGCMTSSLCVAGGLTRGQGLPAELVVLRRGRIIRSRRLHSFGVAPVISCPGTKECLALASTNSGALLVTVSQAGTLAVHSLREPSGVMFDSIYCVRADSCELAGENISGIIIASWNGHRLGTIRAVSIPDGSGFGNYLPVISCSGSWCEVSANIYVPNEESQNLQQLYLITTDNGKPVGSHFVTGYLGDVSCGGSGDCYALLENYSLVGSSGGAFLAQTSRGKVGTPEPIDSVVAALACQAESCLAAGANDIVTFSAGRQTSLRQVAGVRDYLGVTRGPGAFFAAIGAAAHGGSVLTTG